MPPVLTPGTVFVVLPLPSFSPWQACDGLLQAAARLVMLPLLRRRQQIRLAHCGHTPAP